MKQLPDGTRIANLTTQTVRFLDVQNGDVVDIAPEPSAPLRLPMTYAPVLGRRYIQRTAFGTTALPSIEPDLYYIVPAVVKTHCPERDDFVVPNRIIRGQRGNGDPLVCQGFAV